MRRVPLIAILDISGARGYRAGMRSDFLRYFWTAWLIVGGYAGASSASVGWEFVPLGFLAGAPFAAIGAYMKVAIDRRRERSQLRLTSRPE
jgi:hypothetical protein